MVFYRFVPAEVAKLVDALDLGSSVEKRAGSIPVLGTKKQWPVVSCQLSELNSGRWLSNWPLTTVN